MVEAVGLEIISLEYSEGFAVGSDGFDPALHPEQSFIKVNSLDFSLKPDVWNHCIRITCKNVLDDQESYVFDFENWTKVLLKDIGVDDELKVYLTGHLIPYHQRDIKHANHSWLSIDFDPGETKTLLVFMQSSINYLQVPGTLQFNVFEEEDHFKNVSFSTLSFGVFMGFYLIMLIYNLIIYFSTKDENYLYYLAALVASMIITVHNFGYFVAIFSFWESYVDFHSEMQFFSSMLIGWSMLLFTSKFLKVKERYPRLQLIINIFMVLIIFLPVPALMGYASINEKISGIIGLTSMGLILTIAIKSKLDNFPSSTLFLIGYGAFAIGIAVMLSSFLGILPTSVQQYYPVNIGSFFEMAFFSLALGNRINKLIVENREKQERIIQQLREKEEIQANINKELEIKVTERTKEIRFQKEEIEQQKVTIEAEKEKVDELLLNILPVPVARELQENGTATPRYFKNVSVLFADFVNFTKKSAGLRPEAIISDLDYCFRAFDDIIDKHNVEKIKTIGDGYLCASGIPLPTENSAENIIMAAMEMRKFLLSWAEIKKMHNEDPWQIRIGIHSGELVAGVVGKRKFAYDIWGGTVNTAARIETACEPNMINISEATYRLVKDKFHVSHRGKISTKEAELDMYYILEPTK